MLIGAHLRNLEVGMKNRQGRNGFTLVELMVVAVIVAILAAVAIPLMSANKKRAMATEAQAALGTVRSALRAMYAETGAYNTNLNGQVLATGSGGSVTNIPGISPGDLNGRYFSQESYAISNIAANAYTLVANGTSSVASNSAEVAGIVITLNEQGDFAISGL
jgi:prepilin-type N-terminal cleavage/methylation domain-containing protein